jgi:SAM-dependent methyltransferase
MPAGANEKSTVFQNESYKRHAQGFADDVIDPVRQRIAASWFDNTTANAWRDLRGYEIADYLGGVPSDSWLTIGDGRFGLDAIRLMARGVVNVLPTNLDPTLLQVSLDKGQIKDFRVENAERLSFADKSFDYAFCKEAYHHFPRPMIALYEMLRVTRKGVILSEPNDRVNSPARMIVAALKRVLGGGPRHMDRINYEEDGNYVYSISQREIEKVALGLDIPQVAFKGLNDHYVAGVEFEPCDAVRSRIYRKMRLKVSFRDFLCRIGLDRPLLLMACIFHEGVTGEQRKRMLKNGWRIVDLPRNPYLSSGVNSLDG